jgi:hypothetical protein
MIGCACIVRRSGQSGNTLRGRGRTTQREPLLRSGVDGRFARTMPRSVEIIVPSDRTAALLGELRQHDGVFSVGLRPDGSVQPPGDIITVQCSNTAFVKLVNKLDEHDIGRAPGTSLMSTVPASYVSSLAAPVVTRDSSDSSWEEVEQMLTKESHMTASSAATMFISGFFAAAGIASGALHVVIAAMVIAPGFEPFVRIGLGAVTGSNAWRRGLTSVTVGYGFLIAGAAAAGLLLQNTGTALLSGSQAYESSAALVEHWSNFSVASVSVSVLAGIAGTLLVLVHHGGARRRAAGQPPAEAGDNALRG